MRLLREPLFHFLIIGALNDRYWPKLLSGCFWPRLCKKTKLQKLVVKAICILI